MIERITAADVKVGDYIASTRSGLYQRVQALNPGEKSVYITVDRGNRIRPRYTTKLWRLQS